MTPTVCLVQVRQGSKRLRDKMLAKIGHFRLIEWIIIRIKDIGFNKVIFCAPEKDKSTKFGTLLKILCDEANVSLCWGDEANVSLRFKMAIENSLEEEKILEPFHLCRVCGDRPFLEKEFLNVLTSNIHSYDLLYNHHIDGRFTGFGFELLNYRIVKNILLTEKYRTHLDPEHVTLPLYSAQNLSCKMLLPKDLDASRPPSAGKFDIDTEHDITFVNEFVRKNSILPTTADIYRKAWFYK